MTDQNDYQPQDPQQQPQQQFAQQGQVQPPQQYAQQSQMQPQQQYYAPQGQMPQQQYYAPQGAPAKSATALIVLSVLELLFLGGLFAIIPLVFSVQANSAYKLGDIAGGDAKAKNAKIALIVIAAVGVLALIALFATGGFAFVTSGSM